MSTREVQEDVSSDLLNHSNAMNPGSYSVCSGCGREYPQESLHKPTTTKVKQYLNVLEHKTYTASPVEHIPNIEERRVSERAQFCSGCLNSLKSKRVPKGALVRGWAFLDPIPEELKSLSKYEELLVSLRLPCIYSWRLQGGFGQFASRGPPVSFANPVAELASKLPRRPSVIFSILRENKTFVDVNSGRVRAALDWLISNNHLYKHVELDETAFADIESIGQEQEVLPGIDGLNSESDPSSNCGMLQSNNSNEAVQQSAVRRQEELGVQGPLNGEEVWCLEREASVGTEDLSTHENARVLIEHMLRPFTHRRAHMIPSADAELHLESYFPKLFPFGRGGPVSTKLKLGSWVKHALLVYKSRFASNLDFVFFVHSVLRRRRLTGLSAKATIKIRCNAALTDVRNLLAGNLSSDTISKKIDHLIRSGSLNASFETLRGSPAFWAVLKRTSWAYLTHFGSCQIFLTVSAADLIDPYVYMEIIKDITMEEARRLGSHERANLLANNPVAATKVFHRRVQSLFDNFLFGRTSPFCNIRAYLGRIEQQARLSPHLHLLLWLDRKGPETIDSSNESAQRVAQFIELFCTATLPPDQYMCASDISPPTQEFPIPKPSRGFHHAASSVYCPAPNISSEERQKVLSAPIDVNAFSGELLSLRQLRFQMIATQKHVCNSYCRNEDGSCRFFFPFPPQERASIAAGLSSNLESRKIALSPRNASDINSTHPLLTAMCRANTDVTVITGSSIAESMYVCNYASKSDKHALFDRKALERLRKLEDSIGDNRKLLGAVARNSSSVRTIGGQEAVDNLVGNPLTFLSAEVKYVSVQFLVAHPGAITEEQKQSLTLAQEQCPEKFTDLLPHLDYDENACIQPSISRPNIPESSDQARNPTTSTFIDPVLKDYMCRPESLNDVTASEFFEKYSVKVLRKSSTTHDRSMVLESNDGSGKRKIVSRRKVVANRPLTTHILSVSKRCVADDNDPYFAAAALCLHVPFRSVQDLLKGTTLSHRVSNLISCEQEKGAFDTPLQNYVTRSHELNDGMSQAFTSRSTAQNVESEQTNPEQVDDIAEFDEDEGNFDSNGDSDPELPDLFTDIKGSDPFKVQLIWDTSNQRLSQFQPQYRRFREYANDCRTIGMIAANHRLSLNSSPENDNHEMQTEECETGEALKLDPIQVMEFKTSLLDNCKTSEQKHWLQSAMSYLQVFYQAIPGDIPRELQKICRRNPPLFTNAPGGCGKSWLIFQLQSFADKCLPCNSRYIWNLETENNTGIDNPENQDVTVFQSGGRKSRFGKILVLAPTGVAASNCNGFTFHNALRTPIITIKELMKDIPPSTVSKLVDDFIDVICIVLDEYSMASLVLMAYLDKALRTIRPSCGDVCFGGIPVLISGDGFQLPVVGGLGLLTRSKVPSILETIHQHCTVGVLYVSLSQSVRQGGDYEFAQLLLRLRLCESTHADAQKLNMRLLENNSMKLFESSQWGSAPILTARNCTAQKFNNRCIFANGSKRGTFVIHSVPKISKTHSVEEVQALCKKYYLSSPQRRQTRRHAHNTFTPLPKIALYPGMPVMLRINLCPELGLSNGSIGTVQSVVQDELADRIPPHEEYTALVKRVGSLSAVPVVPSVLVNFKSTYKGQIGSLRTGQIEPAAVEMARSTVLIEPMKSGRNIGLPLVPAHSFTMHKSQGLTLPFVIIDPREAFSPGALYVALSRAPSLDRIKLLSPVTAGWLNKHKEQTESKAQVLLEIEANSLPVQGFIDHVTAEEQKLADVFAIDDMDC